MSNLERFFRQLVANLAAAEPARLYQSLSVDAIQRDVLPYRANRRALGIESAEDYEVLLLRLCAGEGELAHTDPPEAQTRFRNELAGSNPDLSLLRTHRDALVSLSGLAVARALAIDPHAVYAPPGAAPTQAPEETSGGMPGNTSSPPFGDEAAYAEPPGDDDVLADEADEHPADAAGGMCVYCGGTLPSARAINFCPHCGQGLTVLRCPACRAEIEVGWRHCATCGAPVEDR